MLVIGMNERRQGTGPSPSPGLCHLRADHYLAVLRKPHRSLLRGSARDSVLPVDLGKASERALPSGAVPLALKSALLGAEVPHCPVGTAHQDLQVEECRMVRTARLPYPKLRPSKRPLTCVSPPAPQHRVLTASSRRGCPAAVKFAACLR